MSRKIYYKSEAMDALQEAFGAEIATVIFEDDGYTAEEKVKIIEGMLLLMMSFDETLKDEDEK